MLIKLNSGSLDPNTKPANMVYTKRFIYNIAYFYKKYNPVINKTVIQYINSKGRDINPIDNIDDIIIVNYSNTLQKHPDNNFTEEKIETNIYFGGAIKTIDRTYVNENTNLGLQDLVFIEDFHFNIIFNSYGKRYFENYSRSNYFDSHNAFRTMIDKEYKFICPDPKYYTYEHQLMCNRTDDTISNFFENSKKDPGFPFYNSGELKYLIDDNTTVLKLNIELDDILSNMNILRDKHQKALILENIVYIVSLIKVHLEMAGFSKINLIFDSHRGFNIKEINAKIQLEPQLLQKQYAILLEYIDNVYQENFQGLVAELELKFALFMYMDPISTSIQLILDKNNLGSTGLNQQEIVENMMTM